MFPEINLISGNTWYPHERVGCFGAQGPSALPALLLARAKASVRATVGLALAWPHALTRTIIARSHAQRRAARAWRQPRSAGAEQLRCGHTSAKQLRWPRTRASQSSGRTPTIDIARLIARYPPACLPTQTTS